MPGEAFRGVTAPVDRRVMGDLVRRLRVSWDALMNRLDQLGVQEKDESLAVLRGRMGVGSGPQQGATVVYDPCGNHSAASRMRGLEPITWTSSHGAVSRQRTVTPVAPRSSERWKACCGWASSPGGMRYMSTSGAVVA